MPTNSLKTLKQSFHEHEERYLADTAYYLKRFDEMERGMRSQQDLISSLTHVVLDLQDMMKTFVEGKLSPELPPEKIGPCRVIDFETRRHLM